MRDAGTVIYNRDKLNDGILKINLAIDEIRNNTEDLSNLLGEERKRYFDLMHLRGRYMDQVRGIDFALNEDSMLEILHGGNGRDSYLSRITDFIVF